MRESRTYGSVRGALSNGRPYRVRLSPNPSTGFLRAWRDVPNPYQRGRITHIEGSSEEASRI
jgi:hypothetical protein